MKKMIYNECRRTVVDTRERTRRIREVKDPSIRKKEILDGAMMLFTTNGYEETSMRDIAAYLGVSLGLCYRYFDSKQKLFQEAMDQYVNEYFTHFLKVLHDNKYNFMEKLEYFYREAGQEPQEAKYHDFFHRPENAALHEELGIRVCRYMTPHLEQELRVYLAQTHQKLRHPNTLIRFLTYGQIGLQAEMPKRETINDLRDYIELIMKHELIPDD